MVIVSNKVAAIFDEKAESWTRKGKRAVVLGDDCPLDKLTEFYTRDGVFVIDIGGGDGSLLSRLAQRVKSGTFLLIDLSRQMASKASKRLGNSIINDDVLKTSIVANAKRIPLPSGCCDIAILRQLLHHTPEPRIVIEEAWRVLKTHGYMLFQVPGPNYLSGLSPYPGAHSLDPIGRFSEREIRKMLQQVGFQVNIWSHGFGFKFENLYDVFKFFHDIALLERLVSYHDISLGRLLETDLITHLLKNFSASPIIVGCEYVVGIAEKLP